MAQEPRVEEKSCLIPAFERNRYFFGKPMTVRDFEAEQQYMIGKSRLHNRLIHGSGIICGMSPSDPKITGAKLTISLSEGAALDCCGNLIVVNKSDTVEVQAQGTLTDGPHYLYVRFSECVKQPIMASANVSSCEEVCCYNRIRETFEVLLSSEAPVAAQPVFTGAVKNNKEKPIVGARVKAFLKGEDGRPPQAVQAETLTDSSGKFSLGVSGTGIPFNVTASATGFSALTKAGVIPLGQNKITLDFVLATQPGVAPADVCNTLTQDYFDGHSSNSQRCDDPKVFLAVVTISSGKPTIDPASAQTRRDRAVVYTNPMLHDLLCDHISDFNNPHRTNAAQVRALQNVNGVGNSDDKAEVVSRIDIVSDGTIKIEPEASGASLNKITIKGPAAATQMPKPVSGSPQIGTAASFAREDHVHTLEDKVAARKHLSDDVFGKLVFSSDSSIKVVAKNLVTGPDDRQIDITTKLPPSPSNQMPSKVTLNPSIGQSADYARGDHAHDLADRVVTKAKLADEVINTLIDAADATITITRDLTSGNITLRTNPATDVSSVGPQKSVGTSLNFARQDHVHNLQINDRKPNQDGLFRLTAGANVEIKGTNSSNELIISATPSQTVTGKPSQVTTGVVRFEGIRVHEQRPSPPIRHGLDANNFAIVLGVEGKDELAIGDLSSFDQRNPLLEATYRRGNDTFQIDLRDTRAPTEQVPVSYSVRWWAIPFTSEMETVVSPPPGQRIELLDVDSIDSSKKPA